MNLTNRWKEYDAKTLPLPAVVQHDETADGAHEVWVATSAGVLGPLTRRVFDENAVIAEVVALSVPPAPEYTLTNEDGTVTVI